MQQFEQARSAARTSHSRRAWLLAECLTWTFAIAALSIWGAATLARLAGARQDLMLFESLRAAAPPQAASLSENTTPDLSLWAEVRVRAWRAALTGPAPSPLAVLRIPRIRLEVAVLPGTDEFVLDRAVGHIEDTALPGTGGNSGIAGHRDGFFRGLKDIAPGDAIELETLDGHQIYRVEETWIVAPEDVWVLDPTPNRSLTLVTCYPFYFIGSAPQRFIVRAVSVGARSPVQSR